MVFIAFPVALVLFMVSFINICTYIKSKQFFAKHLIFGALLSGLIYLLIFLYYFSFTGLAYALGTGFIFPFYMIIIPVVIGFILKGSSKKVINSVAGIFFFSAILSGVLMFIYSEYTFGLPEYFGIQVYH
jgi:hypothetical protein